jgi:hypothetical protein
LKLIFVFRVKNTKTIVLNLLITNRLKMTTNNMNPMIINNEGVLREEPQEDDSQEEQPQRQTYRLRRLNAAEEDNEPTNCFGSRNNHSYFIRCSGRPITISILQTMVFIFLPSFFVWIVFLTHVLREYDDPNKMIMISSAVCVSIPICSALIIKTIADICQTCYECCSSRRRRIQERAHLALIAARNLNNIRPEENEV